MSTPAALRRVAKLQLQIPGRHSSSGRHTGRGINSGCQQLRHITIPTCNQDGIGPAAQPQPSTHA